MALRYRKEYSDEKILDMAEVTAGVLKYVPSERIAELFDAACSGSQYLPDDFKLLKTWGLLKGKGKSVGYYDHWGIWVRDGSYYTWMTCPGGEWIIAADFGEWELRTRNRLGLLKESHQENWYSLLSKKFFVGKGQIQKPRHEWDHEDNGFQARFNTDYEELVASHKKLVERLESQVRKK